MNNELKKMLSLSNGEFEKITKEAHEKHKTQQKRKEKSELFIKIPDYQAGGMIEFWMNEDENGIWFETEDSRIDTSSIKMMLCNLIKRW